jgi:hypothetical protein
MFNNVLIEYPSFIKLMMIISGVSFLFFGITCLSTNFMILEFERYGLAKYRIIVGVLQIVGALGLLFGFTSKKWALIASLGLAVLMICGFIVRIKIKDAFLLTLPSLIYAILNFFIFILLIGLEE